MDLPICSVRLRTDVVLRRVQKRGRRAGLRIQDVAAQTDGGEQRKRVEAVVDDIAPIAGGRTAAGGDVSHGIGVDPKRDAPGDE